MPQGTTPPPRSWWGFDQGGGGGGIKCILNPHPGTDEIIVKQSHPGGMRRERPVSLRNHRRECPAITYMAMGIRPRSFPVGGMYVKGIGRLTKVKKITRFSFPLLLKRKKYFTNPSCLPHWQRKTSPRRTALVSRIGLQPFLRTRWS